MSNRVPCSQDDAVTEMRSYQPVLTCKSVPNDRNHPFKKRRVLATIQSGYQPRRAAALMMIGRMQGLDLPASKTEMEIKIVGPIGQRDTKGRGVFAQDIQLRLAANPHVRHIDLLIDSPGGSATEAARIYAALRAHGAFIAATVDGTCASAAVLPLLAADLRQAECGARLLTHTGEVRPKSKERWTSKQHRAFAALIDRADEEILDLMVERTGTPREILRRENATEIAMSIPRAIHLGLIHCMVAEVNWHHGQPYYFPR